MLKETTYDIMSVHYKIKKASLMQICYTELKKKEKENTDICQTVVSWWYTNVSMVAPILSFLLE